MKKWYQEIYFNKRDWIIANLEFLNLSPDELCIVLLIDYFNSIKQITSVELLVKKSSMSIDRVNDVLELLQRKSYLEILPTPKGPVFKLDNLFETKIAKSEIIANNKVLDLFQSELGKPLTRNEVQKINEWSKIYDQKLIIYALREASINKVLNINYVSGILNKWKKEHKTVADIEKFL